MSQNFEDVDDPWDSARTSWETIAWAKYRNKNKKRKLISATKTNLTKKIRIPVFASFSAGHVIKIGSDSLSLPRFFAVFIFARCRRVNQRLMSCGKPDKDRARRGFTVKIQSIAYNWATYSKGEAESIHNYANDSCCWCGRYGKVLGRENCSRGKFVL